jgi:hypothetical protein
MLHKIIAPVVPFEDINEALATAHIGATPFGIDDDVIGVAAAVDPLLLWNRRRSRCHELGGAAEDGEH